MDITELIKTRRSIKTFKTLPIDHTIVTELLNTAIWAPNHKMTQPWRFIILKDSSKKKYAQLKKKMAYDEMSEAEESVRQKHADITYQKIHDIPLILIAVIEQNEDPEIAQEDYAACACVIDNFMLLAWDQGIGTAWKTFKGKEDIKEFLNIQQNEKVVGVIYTGYPESIPDTKPRASLENRIDIKS